MRRFFHFARALLLLSLAGSCGCNSRSRPLRIGSVAPDFVLKNIRLSGQGAVMQPKIVQQQAFTVIGFAARTSNAKEVTPDGQIGRLWTRLFQENLLSKIPNKADPSIIAVYTDYAADKDGEYTFLLGARVNSEAVAPEGMVAKKIPAGKYAVFTTEKGPGAKVVPEAWMHINSLPRSAVGGNRVYRADFEIYDQRAADPQNLQADVYVGIR